jgi:site-specific DNA-methyltransferase (adenine-specific)
MPKLKDKSIDLVLADIPYGTSACKWDVVIPFEPMWKELKRITKDNGAICLFGNEPFSSHLRMSNIKEFKYDWIWEKIGKATGHLNAKKQPLRNIELISVFYASQAKYYPQMVIGSPFKNKAGKDHKKTTSMTDSYGAFTNFRYDNIGTRYPKQIIKIHRVERETVHPTQKPVDLLEYLIKTYTLEGETVLDFTMGSGSTGVACKNLNRKFIGIEKDDKYFEIAKNRIELSLL